MLISAEVNESAADDDGRPILEGAMAPPEGAHQARRSKLGLGVLTLYGSGAAVENITTYGVGGLLPFYLTIVCGLSGTEAGIATGLTLVVDSIFDPAVGSLSDNTRSRHGRRHPFMLAGILPTVIAYGLLFSVPKGLGGGLEFLYVLGALFAARIAISIFQVPYFALGAELSEDYAERSTIVAWRVVFTVLATFIAVFLSWGLFLKGNGRFVASAYSPLAWSFGGVVIVAALLSTIGTLRARGRLHSAADGARFSVAQFLREAMEVLRNRSFRSLFFTCLILFAALGAAGALTVHANTFFWKLSSGQIASLGYLSPVGVLIGVFGAALLARMIEKRWIAMLGLALIGVAQVAPVSLRLGHIIGPSLYLPTLALATVLGGLGGSVATISFQSMMADAADEHEHLFGARREGLYFAGITLSAKASSGLGALIGLVALDVIHFPHGEGATPGKLAAIPPEIIRNLGITYGPGAALFTAVSVIILLGYKLTKEDHTRILGDLKQRRAGASSTAG